MVKELAIGTDKGWQPAFPYQGDTKVASCARSFRPRIKRCRPFGGKLWPLDHQLLLSGRGRPARHCLLDAADPAGRLVYGVVGVELLTDYLQTKLPFTELDEDKAGTYFIVTTTDDALTDGVLSCARP